MGTRNAGAMKRRNFLSTSRFISEMIQDRPKLLRNSRGRVLSKDAIYNDLERPRNPDFKVTPLFDAQ